MRLPLAACLLAAAASPAAAQDLVFFATEFDNTGAGGTAADPYKDIGALSSATTAFRVGSNPISVAYDGTNLYIGGNVNGPTSVPDPGDPMMTIDLTIEIAELSDFFNNVGTAGAKEVLGSEFLASQLGAFSGRGFSGMDWDDRFGLLASVDRGTPGDPEPQLYLFQRTNPADFNATLQVSTDGLRGMSGPAFDNGFDGSGFVLSDSQNGPAAALPITTTGTAAGLDPLTFAIADDLYGEDFGSPTDPMAPLYTFFHPDSGTLWRDFDIHPDTGLVAARGNNVLVLADRTSLNGTENIRSVIPPQGQGVAVNQNVEILHNTVDGPECVVLNSRQNSGAFLPFQQSDFAGNPLTYEIRLPGGGLAPLDTGNPANIFSFFWYEAGQILFVVDGNNRHVYALTLGAPPSPCPGDVDGDGFTNLADFGILGSNFGASNLPFGNGESRDQGDLNDDGEVSLADFGILGSDFGCTP